MRSDLAPRTAAALVALCLLAAIGLRGGALLAAPSHAYLWDHVMFLAWSDWAYEHGPTSIYNFPARHPLPVWNPARDAVRVLPVPLACNYPPFAGVLFWVQGWLWHAVDPAPIARLPPGVSGRPGNVVGRVANTYAARFAGSLLAMLADVLMAWGVTRLVTQLAGGVRDARRAIAVFAVVVLAPPVVLDSAFFGQTDSWVSCLLVWALSASLAARPVVAGVLFGMALMTKAQALIFAPVLAAMVAAPLLMRTERTAAWRQARAGVAALVVTLLVIAAPFSWATRGDPDGGATKWLRRSYVGPIFESYPYTTVKAFNLWRLQAAVADHDGDARTPILGVSRDAIGRVLLGLGTGASLLLTVRRWGGGPPTWTAFAFLVGLGAFVLPTRVKARYLYYCLPFGVAIATWFRPWRATLAGLGLVATFEIGWVLWYVRGARTTQIISVGLAALTVGLYTYSLAVIRGRSGDRGDTTSA